MTYSIRFQINIFVCSYPYLIISFIWMWTLFMHTAILILFVNCWKVVFSIQNSPTFSKNINSFFPYFLEVYDSITRVNVIGQLQKDVKWKLCPTEKNMVIFLKFLFYFKLRNIYVFDFFLKNGCIDWCAKWSDWTLKQSYLLF